MSRSVATFRSNTLRSDDHFRCVGLFRSLPFSPVPLILITLFRSVPFSFLPFHLVKGTVSGSGTGPLDFGATGPVPDP